jgi:hypothetical protein
MDRMEQLTHNRIVYLEPLKRFDRLVRGTFQICKGSQQSHVVSAIVVSSDWVYIRSKALQLYSVNLNFRHTIPIGSKFKLVTFPIMYFKRYF